MHSFRGQAGFANSLLIGGRIVICNNDHRRILTFKRGSTMVFAVCEKARRVKTR
jgi:hypothetical protein